MWDTGLRTGGLGLAAICYPADPGGGGCNRHFYSNPVTHTSTHRYADLHPVAHAYTNPHRHAHGHPYHTANGYAHPGCGRYNGG